MNNLLKYALLGAALISGSAVTASATPMLVFITVGNTSTNGTIMGDFIGNSTLGANCASLSVCGIYAVGLQADTTAGRTYTLSGAVASGLPPTWAPNQIAGNLNPNPAAEVSGPTETMITSATLVGNFNDNANNVSLPAGAALSAGTTLEFLVNYTGSIPVSGTIDTFTIQVIANQLSNGAQSGSKGLAGTETVNGTIMATPEPSTLALFLGGVGLTAVSRLRRKRNH